MGGGGYFAALINMKIKPLKIYKSRAAWKKKVISYWDTRCGTRFDFYPTGASIINGISGLRRQIAEWNVEKKEGIVFD